MLRKKGWLKYGGCLGFDNSWMSLNTSEKVFRSENNRPVNALLMIFPTSSERRDKNL